MSEETPAETVYVTTTDDRTEKVVMSEKVQSLAGSLYKEFEKVIKKYDEDVVKDLMPLVIGVLEALDASFAEKQELDVELELFREDNEQLLTQYEREKQLRKTIEQKFLELEDNIEGKKSELEEKVETLESLLRMSEIKYKNAADHVTRLEEKEQDLKNEYNKLHERYTELLRTHMENLEQRKVLLGTDRPLDLNLPSSKIIMKGSAGLQVGSVDSYSHHMGLSSRNEVLSQSYSVTTSLPGSASKFPNLKTELYAQNSREGDREQLTESINISEIVATTKLNQTLADIIASTPELGESRDSHRSQGGLDQEHSVHNETSMFDEIRATDIAEVDFASGISDSDKEEEEEDDESKDMDRDSVGDNFYGMCRELENLIQENTELLATKNALNIVKDDLIGQIDVLASEQDMLREEIVILTSVRKKQQERISQLEEEVRKLKDEMNKDKENTNSPTEKEETEDDVPMAQRKRFTRVEMARVLMERNQYKERLMELQEAVRWTEMMRANKEHPGELQTRKKSGVWNFFSEFVSPAQPVPEPPTWTHKPMPAKHQKVLQDVINSSPGRPTFLSDSSHSSQNKPDPAAVSLLPSLSSSSLSTLSHVTLLPPNSFQHGEIPPSCVMLIPTLQTLPPPPSGSLVPTVIPRIPSVSPSLAPSEARKPYTISPSSPIRNSSTLPGMRQAPQDHLIHNV